MADLIDFSFKAGVATGAAIKSAVAPLSAKLDAIAALEAKLDAVLAASSTNTYQSVASAVTTRSLVVAAEPIDLEHLSGMDCHTGKLIRGVDYLRQRITDALTTPHGSQVLLRARGSATDELIDTPVNPMGIAAWIAEIAHALSHPLAGLPDFVLGRVKIVTASVRGELGLSLSGDWLGNEVEVRV